MANEATVLNSLLIRGPTVQQVQTNPRSFNADVSKDGGPCPGEILASKLGTDVVLSQLTSPGLCWIMNLGVDALGNNLAGTPGSQFTWANYVEVGLYDHTLNQFYPLMEILPGEFYLVRLSRFINQRIGTGSGTSGGGDVVNLRVKAIGAASKVIVQAYER